jgi:hypothetical protein
MKLLRRVDTASASRSSVCRHGTGPDEWEGDAGGRQIRCPLSRQTTAEWSREAVKPFVKQSVAQPISLIACNQLAVTVPSCRTATHRRSSAAMGGNRSQSVRIDQKRNGGSSADPMPARGLTGMKKLSMVGLAMERGVTMTDEQLVYALRGWSRTRRTRMRGRGRRANARTGDRRQCDGRCTASLAGTA